MAAARKLAIVCVGLLLAVARPAFGFHTLFHFQVDRFEADGNVFGAWDGVPDFVDDFSSGSYAPNWIHLFGTVSVSDGLLNIQNPGEHFSVGFPVDVSEVWSDAVVSLPMGGVTLTSYWVAPMLTPGSSMHMTLALSGTDGHDEYVGLHVQNTSGDGPAIGLHFLELAGDWKPLQVESVPYDQTATSDRIALRLVIDGGMVTGSFSLDGGATYTSPFTPGVVLPHMVSGRLMLGADPITPLPPSCGNGVVDAGEACDLGRRQNGKGCCTDACTLVDRDGDGVCDPRDDCPDVADPKQRDGDGDGLGDACDPCTAATDGQSRWSRPLVAVTGLNDDHPGNESLRVSGSFAFSKTDMALDPVTTGARLTLRSVKDGSTVTVALPPGPYVTPGPGWLADDAGTKFVFLDRRRGGTAGVRRMGVRRTADGRVRVDLSAPRGAFNFGAWSFPPIHAAIAFGDTIDECGEIRFDDRACAYPQSRRIVCR